MVSSDELESVDLCFYRQAFNVDSWLLPHATDLLAGALYTTVTPPHTLSPSSATVPDLSSAHTLSSNVSGGSDQGIVYGGAKRKRNCLLGSEGKAVKRRSRASKKSQTTFITADPSNFRQMVQQVTGAKYVDDAPVVKPEPHRLVSEPPCGALNRYTAVPTLDTSAFLFNHHQENIVVGLPSGESNATVEGGGSVVEFDNYSTFPTLESWKVV